MLNIRPADKYCPKCEYPIFDDDQDCFYCYQIKKKDKEIKNLWIEQIGGLRAWNEYLDSVFVKTAYNTGAYEAAKSFDYRKHNYLFFGPRGTGKSHLAAIIKRPLITSGVKVLTVSMPDVMSDIKSNIRNGSVLTNWVNRMLLADVLSFEDMAVEKPSEFITEFYYRIIDSRYRQMKNGLIITMNQSLEQLESEWGFFDEHGRIVSRLKQMCGKNIFNFSGDADFREQADEARG